MHFSYTNKIYPLLFKANYLNSPYYFTKKFRARSYYNIYTYTNIYIYIFTYSMHTKCNNHSRLTCIQLESNLQICSM